MDTRTLLSKVISLIYHTRNLGNTDHDIIIKTNLNTIKTDLPEHNFANTNIIKKLKDYCFLLLEEQEPILKETLIPTLAIILEHDQKLLQVIKDSIEPERDESTTKKIISNHIKALNAYYKEQLGIEVISKASYDLKFNRNKIGTFSDYLRNVIAELEPLTTATGALKDPAIVNEMDFENEDSVNLVFEEVKNLNSNKAIYKTGFQALNRMLQGGIRRGETGNCGGALQHNYKTGFSTSIFASIAVLNSPIVTKEEAEQNRKPLLVRISFEDSLTNTTQFIYQYLKANAGEIIKPKDFETLSIKEMTKYIMERMTATGFSVKMIRVDPSQWTFADVIGKIYEYESQGYAVHVLEIDYISMLPTTGCDRSGPIGSDKRDLVRRLRNFCSARNIALLSPFQLNTEVKNLVRNGVPVRQMLEEVASGTMYDGSKTIANDLDFEIFIHLVSHNRKKYLAVQRGKHRLPTQPDPDDMFFMLPFPMLNVPILEDLDKDDTSIKTFPRASVEANESLLDEMLG